MLRHTAGPLLIENNISLFLCETVLTHNTTVFLYSITYIAPSLLSLINHTITILLLKSFVHGFDYYFIWNYNPNRRIARYTRNEIRDEIYYIVI